MIASGEKKEECRQVKPYWCSRLASKECCYDAVEFRNGYSKNAPRIKVELCGIRKGVGNCDWGAPKDESVYILSLGVMLESEGCVDA